MESGPSTLPTGSPFRKSVRLPSVYRPITFTKDGYGATLDALRPVLNVTWTGG